MEANEGRMRRYEGEKIHEPRFLILSRVFVLNFIRSSLLFDGMSVVVVFVVAAVATGGAVVSSCALACCLL